MDNKQVFHPARQVGMIFQVVAVLLFIGLGAMGIWQAAQANIGPVFLLYLAPVLLAAILMPILVYRIYALQRASYTIERNGLRLRWGFRVEDIPMNAVLWVRPVEDMEKPLPRPWLRWPGAVLGTRRLAELGEVEFLASRSSGLVLIAASQRMYAISPADSKAFLKTYHRFSELGSLFPIRARSVYPAFLAGQVWADWPARLLLAASLGLSLALLVWVSLAIPSRSQLSLGFTPDGALRDLVPAIRLLLLPVLNGILVFVGWLGGLFLYRRKENHSLAYLLWGGSALTPLLFLLAVYSILQTT